MEQNHYSAFDGSTLLIRGNLTDVAVKIKKHLGSSGNSTVLIFSDETGKTIDINFQGSLQDVLKRLEKFTDPEDSKEVVGPGRPRLGVISREISLLPRHWEWLATQPGGASATLRLLVEEARKKSSHATGLKQLQERAYRMMSVLAGDAEGYEEALRALYKKDGKTFSAALKGWPKDIQKYLGEMARPVFEGK